MNLHVLLWNFAKSTNLTTKISNICLFVLLLKAEQATAIYSSWYGEMLLKVVTEIRQAAS